MTYKTLFTHYSLRILKYFLKVSLIGATIYLVCKSIAPSQKVLTAKASARNINSPQVAVNFGEANQINQNQIDQIQIEQVKNSEKDQKKLLEDDIFQVKEHLERIEKVYVDNNIFEVEKSRSPVLPLDLKESRNKQTKKLNLSVKSNKNNNLVNLISIRGERHSGTGWLRQLINKNCPKLTTIIDPKAQTSGPNKGFPLDADGKFGWKHGLLKPNLFIPKNEFIIIIFRDWRTWIPKMRENSYERMPAKNLPMSTFLKTPFLPKRPGDEFSPAEMRWNNVFELRSGKYENWMYLIENRDNVIYVRYEDLLDNDFTKTFFEDLRVKYRVDCNEKFEKVESYSKLGRVQKNKGKFEEKKQEINEKDMDTILKHLNLQLEKSLGYL